MNGKRPSYIEIYEPNNKLAFKQNIGIRMHGEIVELILKKHFVFMQEANMVLIV
jgi:hypothetical protein